MWKCPECGSDRLKVVVEVECNLIQEPDGNFQTEERDCNHEWTENSVMTCRDCGEQDIADKFEVAMDEDEDGEWNEYWDKEGNKCSAKGWEWQSLGNGTYRIFAEGFGIKVSHHYNGKQWETRIIEGDHDNREWLHLWCLENLG